MSAEVSIQECTVEQAQTIADIYNEYIKLGNATMEETLYTADDIKGWIEKFDEREKLYVLLDKETVIGWGIIKKYSPRSGYRYTCETAVYLTESEMRKGYGSLMKKFLIEQCKILNYHHLVAKIFAVNKASIEYNLKLGYTIVGTQKEIGYRNGQWQDVVIMQYILKNV